MKKYSLFFVFFCLLIIGCDKTDEVFPDYPQTEANGSEIDKSPNVSTAEAVYDRAKRENSDFEINPEKAFAFYNSSAYYNFASFLKNLNRSESVDADNPQLKEEFLILFANLEEKVTELDITSETVLAFVPKEDIIEIENSRFEEIDGGGSWTGGDTCCADAFAAYTLCTDNAGQALGINLAAGVVIIMAGVLVAGLTGGASTVIYPILASWLKDAGIFTVAGLINYFTSIQGCLAAYDAAVLGCPCECGNNNPAHSSDCP